VNGRADTADPESAVTVMYPVTAFSGTMTTTLAALLDLTVARTPPMTTLVTSVRFKPFKVTVEPTFPLVGEKLFRLMGLPPTQKRGSLAGTAKVAVAVPADSVNDCWHGARNFFPCLHAFRIVAVLDPAASKQVLRPLVLGSPPTFSVTVKVAPGLNPEDDKVETAVG